MVNSGSSANLLALASLKLKKNIEVITPTLTFSTTVAPIYQLGLIPNFVDVEINKFIINVEKIEKSINKKTKAIIIPNLLGNITDYKKIMKIAKKHSLKVIEDSADTIGYSVNKKNFGKFSDISTTSFYASHIVTGAGFGGMVCFNDKKLYEEAKILRGWGRSSATFNESEDIKKRFSAKVSGIQYDGKYIFLRMGYNFLPSEISAAFGLEQLKKLKKNIKGENNPFFGRKHSNETKEKLKKIKLENPTKYWKGKKRYELTEKTISNSLKGRFSKEKHPNWKGENVVPHSWIKKIKGKAEQYNCEICNKKQAKEWSNKNHKYKKDEKDWQAICVKCHQIYDIKFNNKIFITDLEGVLNYNKN